MKQYFLLDFTGSALFSSFLKDIHLAFPDWDLTKQNIMRYSHSLSGPVVQLVRAPACHAGSYEFESRSGRQGILLGGRSALFLCKSDRQSRG